MPVTNFAIFYFAATCTDSNGSTSDFSNQVAATNYESNSWSAICLAWDASATTNDLITNYTVWWGTNGILRVSNVVISSFTGSVAAGTNLTATVWVFPAALTNVVLSVTSAGATNLYMASRLAGPWSALNRTNYVATNAPGPLYFRSRGKAGNKVAIRTTRQ